MATARGAPRIICRRMPRPVSRATMTGTLICQSVATDFISVSSFVLFSIFVHRRNRSTCSPDQIKSSQFMSSRSERARRTTAAPVLRPPLPPCIVPWARRHFHAASSKLKAQYRLRSARREWPPVYQSRGM
jgi:hypothetical protein